LKFSLGPRTRELKDLPASFTGVIPIYDKDSIEKITQTSGDERGRKTEIASYLPKLIISPFVVYFDKNFKFIPKPTSTSTPPIENLTNWEKFKLFMKRPIADHRDTIQVEWANLPAKQSFIVDYYENELRSKNFDIKIESSSDPTGQKRVIQFTFSKESISGVLYTADDLQKPGTDYISLTANINSKE